MADIETQIQKAIARRDKLTAQRLRLTEAIRQEEKNIKDLQRQQKREIDAAVIKRIEASGFKLEDVLQLMEQQLQTPDKLEKE